MASDSNKNRSDLTNWITILNKSVALEDWAVAATAAAKVQQLIEAAKAK